MILCFLLLFNARYAIFEWETPSWAMGTITPPSTQQLSNDMCQIIDSQLLNSSAHELLVHSYNGGLGHKFISLFYSLTYALLTGRRFQGKSDSVPLSHS